MQGLFRATLERNGARYLTIGGSWTERLERASAAVRAVVG